VAKSKIGRHAHRASSGNAQQNDGVYDQNLTMPLDYRGGSYPSNRGNYSQQNYGSNYGSNQQYVYHQRGNTQQYGGNYNQQNYGQQYYQQGYSGQSYINSSGNAQLIGYQQEPPRPGKQIDINKTRKASKKSHGFLKFLLTLLIILAIPIAGYCFLLDQALSFPSEERVEVNQVLQSSAIGKPYYVLLLGSDLRNADDTAESSRSDVIMLMRIDSLNDQITLVTIPRDTPYRTADGSLIKVNETYYQGGAAYTLQAVSDITGVPISHVVEVGLSDLVGIVDALGGVTVEVDTELGYEDALTGEYVTIEPGTQTLNGQQAQIFARARHEYAGQDADRQSNVRTLLNACADSLTERPIYTIPMTILDVAQYVNTDMKSYSILGTAVPMFVRPGSTTVYSCAGPYDGDVNAETGTWMCYEDPDTWSALMATVDSGADPSAE